MNLRVELGDLATHGSNVTGIGEDISEGTRKGRSLEVAVPGLETAPAFAAFRDTWLGQGDRLSLDLTETGDHVARSGTDHSANEDAIERGYDAINPR